MSTLPDYAPRIKQRERRRQLFRDALQAVVALLVWIILVSLYARI